MKFWGLITIVLVSLIGCSDDKKGSNGPPIDQPIGTSSLSTTGKSIVQIEWTSFSMTGGPASKSHFTWKAGSPSRFDLSSGLEGNNASCKSIDRKDVVDSDIDAKIQDIISRSVITEYPRQIENGGTILVDRPMSGGGSSLIFTYSDGTREDLADLPSDYQRGYQYSFNTGNEFWQIKYELAKKHYDATQDNCKNWQP